MDTSRDMVMMKGGQMIMLIDGDMLIMEDDLITPDGNQVKTDGTVIMSDGRAYMLADDEALFIDLAATRIMES